ncbi:MAG: response regulator transcription factor, partial [Pseudomonadota bacterium]
TSSDPKTVVHVIEVARVGGLLLPSSMSLDAHAGQQRPAPQQGTGSIAFSSAQTPYANGMSRSDAASQRFTPREKQVLHCLGTGMQNKLIAHELQLRESTVKVHVRNILKKLRVSSRTQAALLAREINTRADAPTMPHRPPTSGALPGELRPRV